MGGLIRARALAARPAVVGHRKTSLYWQGWRAEGERRQTKGPVAKRELTPKIVDDRLLLFWSGEFKGQSINGRGNWESKSASPDEELQLLDKADKAWQKLLSGSKKDKVVFFNPIDLERVNEDRRASGKKMYD